MEIDLAEWLERRDCQYQSRNSPGFDPSVLSHSGIWRAADEAVLKKVLNKKKEKPTYLVLTSCNLLLHMDVLYDKPINGKEFSIPSQKNMVLIIHQNVPTLFSGQKPAYLNRFLWEYENRVIHEALLSL